MGELIVWVILLASVIASSLIHYGIRKAERKRFSDENRALREKLARLQLRDHFSRTPGTADSAALGFHVVFSRRSSFVELDFGSVAVIYQGQELDEGELTDWVHRYLPAFVKAQFCTTDELQSWLEKR